MNIFELTHNDLNLILKKKYGKGAYHATALYREVFKRGNLSFETVGEFIKSQKLAETIKQDLIVPIPEITDIVSNDSTLKFLCRYKDGLESESVIIEMKNHNTLCVSSQIGCRMACSFCETGKMGFKRNLEVSEIISQIYTAKFILNKTIDNIVFMGMGEPFDNYNNVVKSINIISDQRGLDIAHRHITVSTSGLTDGIQKFAEQDFKKVNLAISLNAPNDIIRSELMPVNRRHNMSDLRDVLRLYPLKKRGSFLIEYVLIRGVNDAKHHAEEVAAFLKDLKVRFNLIPLNKTSSFPVEGTTDQEIHKFAGYLEAKGIFVIKRWSRGDSLEAACGQLGSMNIHPKGF